MSNTYSGVHELKCSCVSVYNGETKKKIISRSIDPVDTRRRFNVYTTSIRRRIDVETTSCVYWGAPTREHQR